MKVFKSCGLCGTTFFLFLYWLRCPRNTVRPLEPSAENGTTAHSNEFLYPLPKDSGLQHRVPADNRQRANLFLGGLQVSLQLLEYSVWLCLPSSASHPSLSAWLPGECQDLAPAYRQLPSGEETLLWLLGKRLLLPESAGTSDSQHLGGPPHLDFSGPAQCKLLRVCSQREQLHQEPDVQGYGQA